LDTAKRVHVICKISERRVRLEVADEGTGFVPDKVPDPTAPENLEKPSGRGLLLMRSYMNRVQYNQKGNAVMMEKDRPDRSAAC
jgi:serine/threonine-protein kinase RsbW